MAIDLIQIYKHSVQRHRARPHENCCVRFSVKYYFVTSKIFGPLARPLPRIAGSAGSVVTPLASVEEATLGYVVLMELRCI